MSSDTTIQAPILAYANRFEVRFSCEGDEDDIEFKVIECIPGMVDTEEQEEEVCEAFDEFCKKIRNEFETYLTQLSRPNLIDVDESKFTKMLDLSACGSLELAGDSKKLVEDNVKELIRRSQEI